MRMAISDFISAYSFSAILKFVQNYFCELVLGFLPDRNQTTAEMFSRELRSIIIEKK